MTDLCGSAETFAYTPAHHAQADTVKPLRMGGFMVKTQALTCTRPAQLHSWCWFQ
jgi:hypothetical protein